jgi:hypothetical protein
MPNEPNACEKDNPPFKYSDGEKYYEPDYILPCAAIVHSNTMVGHKGRRQVNVIIRLTPKVSHIAKLGNGAKELKGREIQRLY